MRRSALSGRAGLQEIRCRPGHGDAMQIGTVEKRSSTAHVLTDRYSPITYPSATQALLLSIWLQVVTAIAFAAATTTGSVLACAGARFAGGVLNGLLPISKTYLSEITDVTNQAKAMSILMASWQVGLVVGPVIGGYLSDGAADRFELFDVGWVRAYPFALPPLVIAAICAVAALMAGVCLEDAPAAHLLEGVPTSGGVPNREPRPAQGFAIFKDPRPRITTLIYAVISFNAIGYDEVYSVWCATSPGLGGLGWNAAQISQTLLLCGLVTVIWATIGQPLVMSQGYGLLTLFKCQAVVTALATLLVPSGRFFLSGSAMWWWVLAMSVVNAPSRAACFSLNAVMINNSVPTHQRGELNGCSISLCFSLLSSVGAPTSLPSVAAPTSLLQTRSMPISEYPFTPVFLFFTTRLGFTLVSAVRSFAPFSFGVIYSWTVARQLAWPLNHFLPFIISAVGCVVLPIAIGHSSVLSSSHWAGDNCVSGGALYFTADPTTSLEYFSWTFGLVNGCLAASFGAARSEILCALTIVCIGRAPGFFTS